MNHEQRYLWLDLIRGISALLVCSSHLRNATMVDFQQIQGQITIFQKIFYFVTGLGHQAVMVFFVLSGFFVGGSVIKAGSNFRVDKYIVARLTRLWVVLLPALIITKFTDTLLEIYEPTVLEGVFRQLWNSGPNPGEYSSGLITFISNMFFLQAIESPVFGTNGPLWSLAYEFWFYVLFPLCMILLGKAYQNHAKKIYFKILSLTLIIDIYFFLPTEIKSGFLVWLLGAGVFVTIGNNILKKTIVSTSNHYHWLVRFFIFPGL